MLKKTGWWFETFCKHKNNFLNYVVPLFQSLSDKTSELKGVKNVFAVQNFYKKYFFCFINLKRGYHKRSKTCKANLVLTPLESHTFFPMATWGGIPHTLTFFCGSETQLKKFSDHQQLLLISPLLLSALPAKILALITVSNRVLFHICTSP